MSAEEVPNPEESSPQKESFAERHKHVRERVSAHLAFFRALTDEYQRAAQEVMADTEDQFRRRAFIRCVGSVIDGYASVMRETAVGVCELYGRELNPFLLEKAHSRGLTSYHRIYNTYRILTDFMPDAPLARIEDSRWSMLHKTIDTRNRILHPESVPDLELSNEEMQIVADTARAFLADISPFAHWFLKEYERMSYEASGHMRRFAKRIGRNDPCPCGSKRKYKHCCGRNERG